MGSVEGFVLAGGRGRRMGVDKARVAWQGWPLAVHVAGRLRPLCEHVRLVRKSTEPWSWPDGSPIGVVVDGTPVPHPLAGVVAALQAAHGVALIVPCDLPHVEPDDLRRLLDAAPAVGRVGDRMQPLVAALTPDLLPRLVAALAIGASSRMALGDVRTVGLSESASADIDAWEGPGPVHRLVAALPPGVDAARVAAGEVARLAARGAVDPVWPDGRGSSPTDR